MFRGLPLRRSLLKVAVMGLILVLASVIAVLSRTSDRAAAATFGPVAEYSFDEDPGEGTTIEDLSGNGHTATIHGAKWTPHGRYGGAMEFNEHEETYLSVPDSSELDLTEEFTLEAWVRPEEGRPWQPIVDKQIGGGEGDERYAWWLYAAGPGPQRPWGGTEHVAGEGDEVAASDPLAPEVWSHVALTFDGAVERLYVDGVLVDSGPAEAPLETEGEVEIGGATETGDFLFGRLDEVRIYDRVLGQPAVAADMETPIQTPKKAPIAEYSFDEGEEAGASVEDLAGENDGTIEGAERTTHGRYGGAMEFGGEPDCVTVPDSASLQLGEEFTVEAWVRPDALFHGPIISKAAELTPSYELAIGSTGNGLVQGWAGGYDEYAETEVHSAQKLEPHVWTHLALTYDGAYLRLYVDGQLAGSSTHAEFVLESGGPLTIGCSTVEGQFFEGRIDEVRLYERALGEAEVGADMEAPIQTPRSGPVAAYSFDEGKTGVTTVEDVSGDGHTATIEDGEWAKGRYGGGIGFDGSGGNKCVSVPDSPELRFSEEFTLEAWIRPEGGSYEDPVVVRESSGKTAFGLGLGSREEYEAEGFIGEGSGSKAAVGGEKIRDYEWAHLAATWDGSKIRLYVDGELADTETATSPPASGEGSLKIGCDGPDGQFTGQIDEVRAYNRTLTGGEVAADMESPIQTPKATPVAAYSFDQAPGEGGTATDDTGHGHTATAEGAKWTEHGRYGGAMEFEAAKKDVLRIPASPELDFSEEFTLEAWVRPSGADNHSAPLIDKQEGSAHGYFLYEGGSVSDRPYGAANEEQELIHATEPLPANAWSHVALTFDGNRTYLYVDDQPVDNGAAEPTITSEGELEIGGSTDTSDYFDGRIDEVRIYNRELDQAEIDADMEAPIQTTKQGPVAAWSFNEGKGTTVEDLTGDGHAATIEGAEWARGKYGGALKFNGTSSCVSVADAADLRFNEGFTLESWIRPEGELKHDPVIFKEGSGHLNYALEVGRASTGKGEGAIGTSASPNHKEVTSVKALEANVWNHLAATFDGATLRLYVNGELVDTESVAGADSAREGALEIGCDSQYGEHFKGRIDEVRVYNRAITAQELDPNWLPDNTPPEVNLSGGLTEGLKTGVTVYGLVVKASDGGPARRQSGVKRVTIAVDGEVTQAKSQTCPQTNCMIEDSWTFNSETYGFKRHEISVSVEDQAGNDSTQAFMVSAPNGSIPACNMSGEGEAPANEVNELSGGGKNYIYHGANGQVLEYPIPPAGFKPSEATDEELDRYGYPPRPSAVTEPGARQAWEETVGESEGAAAPGGCMDAGGPSFRAADAGQNFEGTFVQPNFSGWIASDPTGSKEEWRGASMQYKQPELRGTCSAEVPKSRSEIEEHPEQSRTKYGPGVVSAFVGVEGPSTAFFQAGTNAPYKGGKPYAFTEVFRAGGSSEPEHPDEEPVHEHLAMKAGDPIFVESLWLPGREAILNYTEDLRTHRHTDHRVTDTGPSVYDGRQLDFKIERQSAYQLEDFGSIRFYNAFGYVSGKGWKALGALEHRKKLDMQKITNGRLSGNLMASPDSISADGQSYVERWHHCHP